MTAITQSQDQAVSALILLQHQIQAASLSECTADPLHFENKTHSLEFSDLSPGQLLSPTDPLSQRWGVSNPGAQGGQPLGTILFLHTLSHTFYVHSFSAGEAVKLPANYPVERNDFIVVDDCAHALISRVNDVNAIPGYGTSIKINGFNPQKFHPPVSISLITNRMYYLGKTENINAPTALYRIIAEGSRQKIFDSLSSLNFIRQHNHLGLSIQGIKSKQVYYATA